MAGALPLLFPDGHLLSARWRIAAAFLTIGVVGLIATIVLYPGTLDTPRPVQSPFPKWADDATLNRLSYGFLIVMAAGIVGGGISLILRWQQSSGVVREQLKWLALAVALVVLAMPLSISIQPIPTAIFIAAIATIPLAIGLAVLRYRLYEIDAFISRTVVFGALTAVLTGLFAALQKLFQTVFVAATGNESDAALVITTLILATAFTPLKRSIERTVERRLSDGRVRGAAPASVAMGDRARPSGDPAWDPSDLETMLRRVVREEVRAAMTGPLATTDKG